MIKAAPTPKLKSLLEAVHVHVCVCAGVCVCVCGCVCMYWVRVGVPASLSMQPAKHMQYVV